MVYNVSSSIIIYISVYFALFFYKYYFLMFINLKNTYIQEIIKKIKQTQFWWLAPKYYRGVLHYSYNIQFRSQYLTLTIFITFGYS